MAIPNVNNALRQYQQMNAQTGVAYASPHRLIQMLMEGALERIAVAKGCIQRQDIAGKGEQIGKAIDIIGGLREGLNQEAGGELAANLDALYDFMQQRLVEANLRSDVALLDEVVELLRPVKEAWDAIGSAPNAEDSPAAADAPHDHPDGRLGAADQTAAVDERRNARTGRGRRVGPSDRVGRKAAGIAGRVVSAGAAGRISRRCWKRPSAPPWLAMPSYWNWRMGKRTSWANISNRSVRAAALATPTRVSEILSSFLAAPVDTIVKTSTTMG
ncbi:MAG: flagellar export chaperone FliS [Desulfobacterales bacterium]|nr:flagellar export chaperone FliS [Desulfobacterales bacterium]